MGNTCCSVHIALTGTSDDAIKGIVRAYATLGFERATTSSLEGAKHVIVRRHEEDRFVSVYDSDNAIERSIPGSSVEQSLRQETNGRGA